MSSLGDLLLGKIRERSQSPTDQEKKRRHEENVKNGESPPRNDEPLTNERAFSEHNLRNVTDDTRSNASSTDDYVRELLDPNDRPRNVWHQVEGPQKTTPDMDIKLPDEPDTPAESQDREYDRSSNAHEHIHENPDKIDLNANTTAESKITNDNEAHNNTLSDEQKLDATGRVRNDDTESQRSKDKQGERRRRDRSRDRSSSSRRHRHHHSDRDRDYRKSKDDRHRDREDRRDRSDRYGSRRRHDYSDDDEDLSRSRDMHHRSSHSSRHRRRSRSSSPRRRERSKSDSQSPITKRNSRTILIMQLSPQAGQRDLEDFFSNIGRVREVRLIMDSKTRRHKGIAYIEFEDASSASRAFAMNGQNFLGAPMIIQSALSERTGADWHPSLSHSSNPITSHHSSSRSTLPPNCYRVYVGGLHVALTEDMLRSVFEPFGPIVKVELMKDRTTGISRGYAFLTYANIKDGQEAVRNLDGFELAGKNLRVSKSADKVEH